MNANLRNGDLYVRYKYIKYESKTYLRQNMSHSDIDRNIWQLIDLEVFKSNFTNRDHLTQKH